APWVLGRRCGADGERSLQAARGGVDPAGPIRSALLRRLIDQSIIGCLRHDRHSTIVCYAHRRKHGVKTRKTSGERAMGRNVRKIITRKKIMDAATSQFAEKGFDAASIDSIVDEAKVAHGTVFWHFGNKEQLYVEVARWAGNQF